MRNESKRVAGAAEEIGGKIKGGTGKLIGNKQMQIAGKARELEGKAKLQLAKAADRLKVKQQKDVDAIKKLLGTMPENHNLEP